MNWWEVRRVTSVALGVGAAVTLVCVAICAVFFSVTSIAVGTSLLLASILLVFVGAGTGGGVAPLRTGSTADFRPHDHFAASMENELLAQHTHHHLQFTLDHLRGLSWTLVFAFAAVPVFALSIYLIMWGP